MLTAARAQAEAASRPVPDVLRRMWTLSRSGRWAACRLVTGTPEIVVELRALVPVDRGHRMLGLRTVVIPGLDTIDQLVVDDGGACFVTGADGAGARGVRRFSLDGPIWAGALISADPLFVLPGSGAPLLVERGDHRARVAVLRSHGTVPLLDIPSFVRSALRLGRTTLVANVSRDTEAGRAIGVELTTGVHTEIVDLAPDSDDRVVWSAGDRMVVCSTADGERRLGFGSLRRRSLTFLPALCGEERVDCLGGSADGAQLLTVRQQGVASRLSVVDCTQRTVTALVTPPLVVESPATLGRTAARLAISDATHQGTVATIRGLSAGAAVEVQSSDAPTPGATAIGVRNLPGAAGPVESLVLGDPARAAGTVIALHGGPAGAWRAAYTPLLAALAGTGLCVVAPNVRGSVGYGRTFAAAVQGRWGGPDLADVLAIAEWLGAAGAGGPALVVGTSYGGYLALLAACTRPDLFDGCAALAGFAAARRVVGPDGRIAGVVRRAGGVDSPDVLTRLTPAMPPVLLCHGVDDEVVPVGESRRVAHALRSLGRPVQLCCHPGAGHDLLDGPAGGATLRALLQFAVDRIAAVDPARRSQPTPGSPGAITSGGGR